MLWPQPSVLDCLFWYFDEQEFRRCGGVGSSVVVRRLGEMKGGCRSRSGPALRSQRDDTHLDRGCH